MKKHILLALMLLPLCLLFSCGQDLRSAEYEKSGTLVVASKSGDDVYFIDRADGEVLQILPSMLKTKFNFSFSSCSSC